MSLYIYHEKQSIQSALCGVHCLNALMQRPAFTAVDLAHIAKELDENERQIMASEGHDTKDYLTYITEDSSNVGDDGNFSLQVLQAALHKRNLDCVPLTNSNYYGVVCNLGQEKAFICNLGSHWFTIRKVLPGEWYNLNSLLEQPEHMPEAHLASYLDNLFDKKDVVIYAVKGTLPNISPENRPTGTGGRWVVATGSNREEFELKVAIELSKADANPPPEPSYPSLSEEVSYPKLPDFKNEKISYPSVEQPVEEEPLAFRKTAPKRFATDVPEHLRAMTELFERISDTMENIDKRLTTVEQSFAKIQAKQRV